MNIIVDRELSSLKKLVVDRAKYQKVMLLYDQNISNIKINDIYREIREDCIFNQMDISNLDYDEIYNGYKLLIFCCSTDSFLSLDIRLDEFDNIFIPIDQAILPYYLDMNYRKRDTDDTLIVDKDFTDRHMLSSINLNSFLHYLKSFFVVDNYHIDFSRQDINKFDCNVVFEDVKILNEVGLDYIYLSLIDLLIIDAFLVLINAMRTNDLLIIDAYKECKYDELMIDKIYARTNDNNLINIIRLNYVEIFKTGQMVKEKILLNMAGKHFSDEDIKNVIAKLKKYSKQDDGIIGYLYVYDVFNV